MEEQTSTPVTPENPSIVKGGPLDPTSPEGTPSEGMVTGEAAAPSAANEKAGDVISESQSEPLYRGLTGEIRSAEDLKTYTKQLEDLFVQAKAAQQLQNISQTPPPLTPPVPTVSAKEKFAEVIYSNPQEAFELTLTEAKRQIKEEEEQKRANENRKAQFWQNFYEKNSDLKNLKQIVESVVSARASDLAKFPTEKEVEEFLSRETRKMVDLVRGGIGVTETRLASGQAVTLRGSGEPVPAPNKTTQAPLNFTDQVRRLRPGGKK